MRNGESKLSLAKLMGSTIDAPQATTPASRTARRVSASGRTRASLLKHHGRPAIPVIDLFEGQTLTVTVTFEDGRTSTQAIELHAANFETEMVDGTPA
ncbi:MAG: hypothetical protein ACLSVD_06865 [Eggerthellaceae bacterium]